MDRDDDTAQAFRYKLKEALSTPGVSRRDVADWVGVHPSTVTRWCQGTLPPDPAKILTLLEPHLERAQKLLTLSQSRRVESWQPLTGDASLAVRTFAEASGLLAYRNVAIACWIPESAETTDCDVHFLRYFDGVWADLNRGTYHIGDVAQVLSKSNGSANATFSPATKWGRMVGVDTKLAREVGRCVARFHIQLNLEDTPYRSDAIGHIGEFGYAYRATHRLAKHSRGSEQTSEFLGTTIPIACKRYSLLVCIPASGLVGSPRAITVTNHTVLDSLLNIDDLDDTEVAAALWPVGACYDLNVGPEAHLTMPRTYSVLNNFPSPLQEWIKAPLEPKGSALSVMDILTAPGSTRFLLDLYNPHPLLTANVVWRLPVA